MMTNALRNLTVVACLAASSLAAPATASAEEIEFGKVRFKNDYRCTVTVRLYHADDLDRVFATWQFRPNCTAVLTLNGEAFTIGGDWLIKVEFSNGASSPRRLVYKVGSNANRTWTVYASDVYEGK
jgi:hypothetical protein